MKNEFDQIKAAIKGAFMLLSAIEQAPKRSHIVVSDKAALMHSLGLLGTIEQQFAAIGAGGVEALRKGGCLVQIQEPAAVAVPDEREAFEAWADARKEDSIYLPKFSDGTYINDDTHAAWEAWQARAALSAAPAADASLQERFSQLLSSEHELSESYVRLREILGAMDPPTLSDPTALYAYIEGVAKEKLQSTSPAAAPVVLPEPVAVISEVMGLVNEAINSGIFAAWCKESADSRMDEAKHEHNSDIDAIESKLRALLATGGQVREELPQAEGADYFVILDPEDGTVEFAYSADLGRDFGHEHIKDAQELDNESAHCWVVRPAYAAPQQADARDATAAHAAEYNRWIKYHAAGDGDYDDFICKEMAGVDFVNGRAA